MPLFQYDTTLLEHFPRTVGSLTLGEAVENHPTPPALQAAFAEAQQSVRQQIGETPLSELPSLAAWRSTFSAFGAAPTKYRSAPEALLRRLMKKGELPSINALVDIGNMVSIQHALPVAVFDLANLTGGLTVRFAEGNEHYTELGSNENKHPDVGEVIFADDAGLVFARRWCWKQSFQSAAKITTTRVLITIEAQHENGSEAVKAAQAELDALLSEYIRGNFQSQHLARQSPMWQA